MFSLNHFSSPFASNIFSGSVKPFKGQVYEDLKRQAQEAGQPFEDPEFAAADSSLFYSGAGQLPGQVVWKRPKVKNPLVKNALNFFFTILNFFLFTVLILQYKTIVQGTRISR